MNIEEIPFHRIDAKYAENICFMFAVEKTANIKGNSPQSQEIAYMGRTEKSKRTFFPKGVCF
jgi:hypothetical protein